MREIEPWDHSTYEIQQQDLRRIMAMHDNDEARRVKRKVRTIVFRLVSGHYKRVST